MQGTKLQFFVHENRRHKGKLVYEWLLDTARDAGIHGGSAFRAIAGFGRHGVIHEQHFFELADDLPVTVVFTVSDAEADALIQRVGDSELSLFYVRQAVEYGVINGD